MVVLVLVYVICWMPFWILYTWIWACNHIHWRHITEKQWLSGDLVITQPICKFNDILIYKIMPCSFIVPALHLIHNISFQGPPHCHIDTVSHAQHYLQYLGYINSLINPFIYTGFNQEFRNLFQNMLSSVKNSFVKCLSSLRLNKHPPNFWYSWYHSEP